MSSIFQATNENCIEWLTGDEWITVTLSERHLWSVVRKLAKKYPDRVEILAEPKNNSGYMYAHLPIEFLQIRDPGRQPAKSEEQIEAARERIKKINDNMAANYGGV